MFDSLTPEQEKKTTKHPALEDENPLLVSAYQSVSISKYHTHAHRRTRTASNMDLNNNIRHNTL